MTFQELKALCALLFTHQAVAAISQGQLQDAIAILNRESIRFGFSSWVETYHAPEDAR